MADKHSPEVRSYNMSRIRGKDTKPELLVRKFLFSRGLRFRLHNKTLPGRPDIVLTRYKAVIFIHGCFWHCHEHCKYFKLPASRQEYWIPKLENNILRDIEAQIALRDLGWKVLTIWECELKKKELNQRLATLVQEITSKSTN